MTSPCINVCKLDLNNQYCVGCHRTLIEIRDWSVLTLEKKQDIISACELRKFDVLKENLPCQQK
jgi:predicted Fe-S protein YdhL (DUF1289 family)